MPKAHNTNRGRRLSNHGVPRPQNRGPRPHVWATGPDPQLHNKWRIWGQQKNQAQWREEGWDLSFEDWCQIWSDLWSRRGRCRDDYCMTRRDWSLPWTPDNVQIVTRSEHAKMQGNAVAQGWRSQAQKKRRIKLGLTT